MIDLGIIITGGIGLLSTVVSGWVSWFFARRKYNTEVDSSEIENLKKALEFYKNIVEDNNEKLKFYIRLSEANRLEVYRLKGIVHRLLNNSCLDTTCAKRKFFTQEEIKEILGEVSTVESEENDETEN